MILPRTTFASCLFIAAWAFPLQAQQDPPLSRFNVQLGAIRAPNTTEVPTVSWNYTPNVSFTADGKEVFLSNPVGGNHDLYVATRANPGDSWGPVQPVGTPVNTQFFEGGPCISADGLLLLWSDGWGFAADPRPGGQGNSDLWMSTRTNRTSPWSEPVNLGPQVNTAGFEAFPKLTADALELYFCSTVSGVTKLYVSSRANRSAAWGQATPLPDYLNLPYGQWIALPSPDGLTLLTNPLVSGAPSYQMDILVSTRKDRNSPWNLPVSIGAAINDSQWNQVGPWALAPDGTALYFHHDDGTGIRAIGENGILKRVDLLPVLEITVGYSSLFNRAVLERSATLPANWAPVTEPGLTESGETRVTLPTTEAQSLFRLRSPQP